MIDLQVRTETGEIVAHGSCGVPWTDALGQLDQGSYPCLGGLLPYADTIFNARQVGMLAREVSSPAAREVLGEAAAAEIERLGRQVVSGSHLYLWFLGD